MRAVRGEKSSHTPCLVLHAFSSVPLRQQSVGLREGLVTGSFNRLQRRRVLESMNAVHTLHKGTILECGHTTHRLTPT